MVRDPRVETPKHFLKHLENRARFSNPQANANSDKDNVGCSTNCRPRSKPQGVKYLLREPRPSVKKFAVVTALKVQFRSPNQLIRVASRYAQPLKPLLYFFVFEGQ